MKPAITLLLILGATSCAEPLPPPAAKVPEAPIPKQPMFACQTTSLAMDGIHACMPGTPEEVSFTEDKRWVHGLRSKVGDYEYLVARTGHESRKGSGENVLLSLVATFPRITEDQPFQLGDFEGRQFKIALDAQRQAIVRAIVVGGQVYLARVDGPITQWKDARSTPFFDSLTIDVPWTIHASEDGRFTVAIPLPARWISDTQAFGQSLFTYDLFSLGGADKREYIVGFATIHESDTRTLDEILDLSAQSMGARDGSMILKMKSITLDGFPAREIVFRSKDGTLTRARIYGSQHRIAMILMTASRQQSFETTEGLRFFDSFQLTAP